MTKITFIGAGSLEFTRALVRDILTFPLLENSTLSLMDINSERLSFAKKSVEKIIELGNYSPKIEATLDLDEALLGADIVLVTILYGNTDVWRYDIEIPKQYGIDINVGDTRGPGGIFRFLRTIPVMQNISRKMERLCPDAVMLNYTNPMAMLCGALQRTCDITVTGLCHSVQGTAKMLADWINAPFERVTYTCAGLNHMAWYLKFAVDGKDAYPEIRKAITENTTIYNEEIVRNEMYLALGYYVTESSGHNSEYNWWFRKRPDLISQYCLPGTGWNPGEYAYILKKYQKNESTWKEKAKKWFSKDHPIDLDRGEEYAAFIINALKGGDPFKFNGNVPNTNIITNLPENACVEVPVYVDKEGFHPIHVGSLPDECALLTQLTSGIEEMVINASIAGDPNLVYKAICHDPLTASVLSLREINNLTNDLFNKNKEHLPQFNNIKI